MFYLTECVIFTIFSLVMAIVTNKYNLMSSAVFYVSYEFKKKILFH